MEKNNLQLYIVIIMSCHNVFYHKVFPGDRAVSYTPPEVGPHPPEFDDIPKPKSRRCFRELEAPSTRRLAELSSPTTTGLQALDGSN